MAKQSMSDRIYEHYLAFGTSKKKAADKISRQEFYRRYGNTAMRRKKKGGAPLKRKKKYTTGRTAGVAAQTYGRGNISGRDLAKIRD